MKPKIDLSNYIATVPGFPKEGILFRDITPLMLDGEAYHYAVSEMTDFAKNVGAEVIVGPEARGFIFGCPVANNLKIGFAPVRKPGKLPREAISIAYDLEYGNNELSLHKDAIKPGQKVLVIDDLLATGGTIKATIELIEKLGGVVAGAVFLIELEDLNGRKYLEDVPFLTLLKY